MKQDTSSTLQLAVLDYFAGERFEMLTSMAALLVVAAVSAWLFISSRTGFSMGLLSTVVLFGGALAVGLASLMIRDKASVRAISQALQTEQCTTATANEKARIAVVLSKYKYYRYGGALIALVALAGLTLSDRGWTHGAAAGLLLVVVAQVVIDHFSEQRAHDYFERL